MSHDHRFALGRFALACGEVMEGAHLSYRVLGQATPTADNLVLYPSSYGAWPEDIDWVVGPILDPERWCVVLVSQFGNGRSSSPSTGGAGVAGHPWPVTHADNVGAQRRLLEQVFGVEAPALIYGWSMGAQQGYHWAVLEPGRCRRLLALCGTARTTPHNRLFLLSLRRALTADPSWNGRCFEAEPLQGLRAFASIYASWAASQAHFRDLSLAAGGWSSLEDHVDRAWLPHYRRHDPHDLLAMIDTWWASDVATASGCGDDLAAALGRVSAAVTVMAGSHDLYFTPDDCAAEAALIREARFELLPSTLGHRAGNPRDDPALQRRIRDALDALLERSC